MGTTSRMAAPLPTMRTLSVPYLHMLSHLGAFPLLPASPTHTLVSYNSSGLRSKVSSYFSFAAP